MASAAPTSACRCAFASAGGSPARMDARTGRVCAARASAPGRFGCPPLRSQGSRATRGPPGGRRRPPRAIRTPARRLTPSGASAVPAVRCGCGGLVLAPRPPQTRAMHARGVMWCAACRRTRHWESGRVIRTHANAPLPHNPDHREWQRSGGGVAPREVGDLPCGNLPDADAINVAPAPAGEGERLWDGRDRRRHPGVRRVGRGRRRRRRAPAPVA